MNILVCKSVALFWIMPLEFIPIVGMTGPEGISMLSLPVHVASGFPTNPSNLSFKWQHSPHTLQK